MNVQNRVVFAVVAAILACVMVHLAEAAVWRAEGGGVWKFLDLTNWDVSTPPTNGESMVFGPLAAMSEYRNLGQTVLVEAKLSNESNFKAGLKWTLGPITDTEVRSSRRSWKVTSADATSAAAPRNFLVDMIDPTGYSGWWRLMYAGVTVSLADSGGVPSLSTVSTEGFATINVPAAGSIASIGDYASGGTLAKTGAGKLEIGAISGTDAIIHLKEGSIDFKGRSEESLAYAPGAIVHLDASCTDTMVLSDGGDGRRYVERWNSIDGIRGYATNIMYNSASWGGIPQSHAPFISPIKVNGLSLIDFGSATSSMSDTLGPINCMLTLNGAGANLSKVREVFYAGYYTENNNDNTLILGSGSAYHYSRTASAPFASWSGSGVLSGDIMINGRKVSWDHQMIAAAGDDYTSMHTFSVGGITNSTITYLGSDRTNLGGTGGCRLGEVIIYTNELTRAQRVATHRYLMRKWLPREKWSEYDLDALTVASADTPVSVSSPDSESRGVLRVANVSAHGGNFVKTGDGTLEIGRISPAGTTIDVQEGAVAFAPPPPAPDSPAESPQLWLDATKTASLTFTNDSGTVNYVGRWSDCRTEYADRYVEPPTSGYDVPPNAPYMAYEAQNGLNAVSFGKSNALRGGDSSWVKLSTPIHAYEGFMAVKVYSTTTYGVNLFDCEGSLEMLRSSAVTLLSGSYAYMRGRIARWSVDGAVTDPVRNGSFKNDGVYHIVHFSSLEPIRIVALAKDRLMQNSEWGQLEMGEVLLYTRRLDPAERDRTERYLMRRWLEPNRCRDFDNLTVKGELALGGAMAAPVAGSLNLADGAVVTCDVSADGTCGSMTIDGELTFGGSVTLQYESADKPRLEVGEYTLFSADSIAGFDASRWTLETSAESPRPACVLCDGRSVVLRVDKRGLVIICK